MAGSKSQGPMCMVRNPVDVVDGTSPLCAAAPPKHIGAPGHHAGPPERHAGPSHDRQAGHSNAGHSSGHKGGHSQEEQYEHAEHYAHVAHELHLAAEAVEITGHALHKAHHYSQEIRAAIRLMKAHGQQAYDLRRMARGVESLKQIAKQGGAVGPKAAQQAVEAEKAFSLAKEAYEAEKAAVAAASKLIQLSKDFRNGIKGISLLAVGRAAHSLETALHGSRIGRVLLSSGRIVASPKFVRGLMVVGAALEGYASYVDTPAKTKAGKVANAILGAGGGALVMANPLVAGADLLAPKGYKLSEIYHGGAAAWTAIGEGVFAHDTRAMDEFHRRSMEGHYGKVMQAASEAGVYWADKGIVGGLAEFRDSVRWWISH